jgi:predicted porin
MKKLILAAAVAAAATSANAATIFEGKGLKYDLKGDWQVQMRQKVGADRKMDMEFDDLELKNRITYDLGDGMTAFGQLDFSFDKAANGNANTDGNLEEAYLGLAYNGVALRLGKQNLSTDEFGVEEAYEGAGDSFDQQGDAGDDTIRVDASLENVFISASYELDAEGNSNTTQEESFDLFVAADLEVASVMAAYQSFTPNNAETIDTWGVGATFDAGFAEFGFDYSDADKVAETYNLVTTFAVAPTTKVSIGLYNEELYQQKDTDYWYANVTYKFPAQKNVSLFAEIADDDKANSDMGYLAGIRIKF